MIASCSAAWAYRVLVLIDSDAFCKLGICDLIDAVATSLGATKEDCRRLPALPHMLKRGALHRSYGSDDSERLRSLAETFQPIPEVGAQWLDQLTNATDVDPGEALLFAASIENDALAVTGDKRAIRAVSKLSDVAFALTGRIVTLEAALDALCADTGSDSIRTAVAPLAERDPTVQVCFSEGSDPREGLASYQRELGESLPVDLLWSPATSEGG